MQKTEQILNNLFEEYFGEKVVDIEPIPPSGSTRRYWRLSGAKHKAIGSYGNNKQENAAFFSYTKTFSQLELNVPQLYAVHADQMHYIQEDLGQKTLYECLPSQGDEFSNELIEQYKLALQKLVKMQLAGGDAVDFSQAFPRSDFDRQSMLWDCNYFKYYFLNATEIVFDEQRLEEDFQRFVDWLLTEKKDYFLFRDFQSRNIILRDDEVYFVDYQGGRRGALQYDVASLLYQAKANLPADLREQLLETYIAAAAQLTDIQPETFKQYYYGFALIRQIQVLGAYGRRGLIERKEHFLKSIPFALKNIVDILTQHQAPVPLPELRRVLFHLAADKRFLPYDRSLSVDKKLLVTVQSFSYKKGGIPPDASGNGGGFVFDVRFLHNPGRYQPYKKLTGLDQPVIDFLKSRSTIDAFLQDVYQITDSAVENYLERDFSSLMISFGCTGGQHRSVYSAEAMARHLREKYGVNVVLRHRERQTWPI